MKVLKALVLTLLACFCSARSGSASSKQTANLQPDQRPLQPDAENFASNVDSAAATQSSASRSVNDKVTAMSESKWDEPSSTAKRFPNDKAVKYSGVDWECLPSVARQTIIEKATALHNIKRDELSAKAQHHIMEKAPTISGVNWEDLSATAKQFFVKGVDLLEKAQKYIQDHPYQTGFLVLEGLVLTIPAYATMPFLRMIGFGPLGPKAGTVAAKLFSRFGPLLPRSVIATIQSAAMNGYGAPIINGVAQTVAAVGATGAVAFDHLRAAAGRSEDDEKTQSDHKARNTFKAKL